MTADCSLDFISSMCTRCLTNGNIGSCRANTLTTIIPSWDLARATLKNLVLPKLLNTIESNIYHQNINKFAIKIKITSHRTAIASDRSDNVRLEIFPRALYPPVGCPSSQIYNRSVDHGFKKKMICLRSNCVDIKTTDFQR